MDSSTSAAAAAPPSTAGWIGTMGQLTHYLATVGCDRDEEGRFLVRGSISTFMGAQGENAEVVVAGDAVYRVGGGRSLDLTAGRWCNLAAGMKSTSYGLGVTVIA